MGERGSALRPRAVGIVKSEWFAAWASWDDVELRTASGEVVVRASPPPEHPFRIHDARFAGGRYLVLGIGTGIMSHGLWALDVLERRWAPPVVEHWSDVGVLAGCADTPTVLFADGADVVRWDLEREREVARLPGADIYAGAFHPEGQATALAGPQGLVLFDARGQEQGRAAWTGAEPTAMAFVNDHVLTAAFEGELRLYDCASLTLVEATRVDVREIDRLAVSPDGRRVACCGGGRVHVLDARTLSRLEAPVEADAAAFGDEGCVTLSRRGTRWL